MSSMSMEIIKKIRRKDIIKAIFDGNIQTVRKLLINRSNVDINMGLGGYLENTALHIACQEGKVEIAQLLLDHGANINHTNTNGNTALHIACKFRVVEIVPLLLQRGANVNQMNIDGNTPLHIICYLFNNERDGGNREVMKDFLQYKTDPTIIKAGGFFREIAEMKYIEVMKDILQYKADPTIKNGYQETPMYIAYMKYGDDSIFLKLMKKQLQQKPQAVQSPPRNPNKRKKPSNSTRLVLYDEDMVQKKKVSHMSDKYIHTCPGHLQEDAPCKFFRWVHRDLEKVLVYHKEPITICSEIDQKTYKVYAVNYDVGEEDKEKIKKNEKLIFSKPEWQTISSHCRDCANCPKPQSLFGKPRNVKKFKNKLRCPCKGCEGHDMTQESVDLFNGFAEQAQEDLDQFERKQQLKKPPPSSS